MSSSILTDVKKMIGPSEIYDQFDTDLIIHINSVFNILNNPEEEFREKDPQILIYELDNYHLINHDWIIKWKETISFDKLDKQTSNEIKNSICDFIQENTKSNYIKNLTNIGNYCLKDNNKDIMKSFDIIEILIVYIVYCKLVITFCKMEFN